MTEKGEKINLAGAVATFGLSEKLTIKIGMNEAEILAEKRGEPMVADLHNIETGESERVGVTFPSARRATMASKRIFGGCGEKYDEINWQRND